MAKRTFALMLVLAMLVSLLPQVTTGVTAEGITAPGASEWANHTGHDGWTNWGDDEAEWTTLPTAAGKYYLTHDVAMTNNVTISADVHLCLNGHEVKQTVSGKRHIYLNEGFGITFSLYDCGTTGKITGGSAGTGSVINVTRTNTFKMYGGKITGNNTSSDAVIYVQAANATRPTGGVFCMYGGEISGNKCSNGVIYGAGGGEAWTNSQVNIYGGTIKDNQATASGGAIYVKSYGTLHIENATITGNKAGTAGSAIYAQNHTPITIKNSTITGNIGTSTKADSQTNGWSAAIYICGAGNQLTLSGKVVISGNTTAVANTADIALNHADNSKLYVNELAADSAVVFRAMKADAATADAAVALNGTQSSWTDGWLTYMDATGATKNVAYTAEDGFFFGETPVVQPPVVTGHTAHKLCNDASCTAHGEAVDFLPWESNNSLPTEGNYYLTENVTLTATYALTGNLRLCLNGKTVTQTTNNRFFSVTDNMKLDITDCAKAYTGSAYTGGVITGGKNNTGSFVIVREGAVFSLYAGRITNCGPVATTEQSGAPVYLRSTSAGGATFNMYGGEITGNGGAKCWGGAATNGGGNATNTVYINMYGGKIFGNTAIAGGAFRMMKSAVVTIYDGEICDNEAKTSGGAVYLTSSGATLDLRGGNIHDNTAATSGAGIYKPAAATVTVSGASVVYNNTVAGNQNNLYLDAEAVFTAGQLTQNAKIGVSRAASRTAEAVSANTVDAATAAYFVSDDAQTYELQHKDGYVALVEKVVAPPAEPHVHKLCNDASCTGHGADVDFQPWDSNNSLPTSGNYYLTQDVNLTAVVSLNGNLNLCLNGKTIKQTASNTRIANIEGGAVVSISDCGEGKLTGGSGTYGAALSVRTNSTFNLYGGKITGNQRANSGNAEGTVYIQAATASASGGVFNMYGGEVSGNKVSRGGAISMADSGSNANPGAFNMYGGALKDNETVIADNKGGLGGAINLSGAGVLNIQGGTISGNKAAATGGAIYLNKNAVVTIANAQITGNQSGDVGGAIRTTADVKSLTISGNTVITGNKNGDTTDNLHLVGAAKITVGAMTNGAKVGLTIDAGRTEEVVSTNTVDASALAFFASDAVDDFEVTQKNGYMAVTVKVITQTEHMHKACNDAACSDHATVPYVKWESDNSLPAAGNYYLTKDVQLSAVASVTGELNLCLNGHTVTAADGKRVITIAKDGGLLNLSDCSKNPGALTGGTGTWGAAININTGATFNMFGGKITGNQNVNASSGIGAIYIQGAGSAFNMYGGEISGNEGVLGIIYSPNGITGDAMQINLYGGVICNNKTVKNGTAGGNGGAITAYGNTLVTIDGGKICNNEAEGNGGGLFVNGAGAVVTMNSGEISGNKANNGGGMIFQTRSKFVLNGGEISGNEVTGGGGGFYTSNTTELEMNGGLITGNKSGGSGAGFFCFRNTVTINGGEVIGNEAGNRAGGVAIQGAKAEIKKITVKGNSAKQGGAFYINRGTYESNGETLYDPAIVNIYDGVLITENKAEKECGGLLMANDEVVVTMLGGEISKNKAENGAGAMTWKGATFVLKGGKITGNVTSQYGGVYISNDSTFKMEGGTISNNTSKGGSGVYFYRSTGVLSGGTITGNRAKYEIKYTNGKETKSGGNGGAIYVSGSKVTLSGTNLTNNTADGNGGAVVTGRYTLTTNGVKTYIASTLTMTGGTISGNKATNAGGILTQTDTVFHFKGGLVTKNEATAGGGGIYISTKSTMHMTGGRVVNNYAEKQGGGLYCLKSTVNITGGEINSNTSGTNSGNMMVNGDVCVVNVKDMKFYGGESNTAGAIVVQSKGTLNMENCDVYDNKTTTSHGGAVFVSNKSFGNFTNCRFFENESANCGGAVLVNNFGNATFRNCEFYDNTAAKQGGAIWCSVASKTNMEGCSFTNNAAGDRGGAITCKGDMVLTDCVLEGNTAGTDGGAIYTDVNTTTGSGIMKGLEVHETVIRNNTAAKQGGGLFIHKGCKVKLYDTQITGNTSGAEGGAMWVYEDLELHDTSITGNTSGGEGYAVYMNDAMYDGHSYFTSRNKLSGDVVIKDNNGGDLWMGPDVVFAITADGLGAKAHIELVMDSGVVTNRILGAYHYEGGEQVYTITYGDRSVTDPEVDASLLNAQKDAAKVALGDIALYAGIGVFALAVIAVVAILLLKKKKSPAGETK